MSELPCYFHEISAMRDAFAWRIPKSLNLAEQVCSRHSDNPASIALIDGRNGDATSFADLERLASRMAHVMGGLGIQHGDRVAVLLGQRVETAAWHIAAWKRSAISLPLFQLFGPEALAYRLRDSGARLILTDHAGFQKLSEIRADLPELEQIILVDAPGEGAADLPALLSVASDQHPSVPTLANDPAVLIYTSGTTGNPKGALHAHRVLAGHLPGVQMSHDLLPKDNDRLWTPADWAWIGGLFDVLMPALYFGLPVVMHPPGRFDPEFTVDLLARHQVRNAFLPPTALRILRQAELAIPAALPIRSIASGGERLGDDVLDWAKETMGIVINEFYGQTECNMIVSNCACLTPPKSGAMGLAVPGHEVAVIDGEGQHKKPGEVGDIAVRRGDPAMFLSYWNQPFASAEKFQGDWMLTGDRGLLDVDGFFTFIGRDDDIIASAGYRIGPAEIEACLCSHPAVAQAAVIGVPDKLRGQAIEAHLVLGSGMDGNETLTADIQDYVKNRLAAYEYPRKVVYRDSLPLTATGKIRRAALRAETGDER